MGPPGTSGHVTAQSLLAFNGTVRELTGRTRGRTMPQIVMELRRFILFWRGYFGFTEMPSLRDLDQWSDDG
jgi:RNA-directed DNA polymerase